MSDGAFLISLFFAPLIALIPLYIRFWKDLRRPTAAVFEKWRPWLTFTEHPAGQQNHLPRNQAQRTNSAVFWVAESQRCFFRLRFGLGGLGAIGRISWHDEEIRIEGRISPLTIAWPWIIVIWFDVFVAAAYLLDEAPHNVKTLVSLVGLITAILIVTFGLVYLMQAFLERLYFRRAYQEIKGRIWSAA